MEGNDQSFCDSVNIISAEIRSCQKKNKNIMNSFLLVGLFIAAVSASPISDRIDKLESNLTHLWDMVHDMEEHHGGGVHIHLQTNDQDGGHSHESTHLKTDDDGAHVYLHMDMHDDFAELIEEGEYENFGHHHHHGDHTDLPDEHGEHHGPLDDHSDAKDDDDDDDDANGMHVKMEHNDLRKVHHHHHHHHHHHRQHHKGLKEAHCDLVANGDDKSGMTGHIHLKEIEHNLLSVHVDFKCPTDIVPGTKLALHVHEGSDMSKKCDSLGGHYNPYGTNHGSRTDAHEHRHVGDWSNIVCDSNNEIEHEFYERLSHLSGPHSIMNRSIVIHRGTDDHGRGESPDSKKSGAAGERLACCIITEKMD